MHRYIPRLFDSASCFLSAVAFVLCLPACGGSEADGNLDNAGAAGAPSTQVDVGRIMYMEGGGYGAPVRGVDYIMLSEPAALQLDGTPLNIDEPVVLGL